MGESGEGCGKDRFQKGRDNSTPGGPPGSFDRTGGDDLEKDRKGFLCWVMEGVKKSGFFTVSLSVWGGAASSALTVSKCEHFDPFFSSMEYDSMVLKTHFISL